MTPLTPILDPIEFEIFKSVFVSIAEEMGVTLCRTGFSPNIKERLDYSCAIYDAAGHTIAQGDHLPVHLGAMPMSVRAAITHVQMAPGDTVILNDPFRGGTHLPDITLVTPIFLPEVAQPSNTGRHPERSSLVSSANAVEGPRESQPCLGHLSLSADESLPVFPPKPIFYVANRAHHSDVGGMSPGSMPLAREIFAEGLILPPIKLVTQNKIVPDILALILANVRTPIEREGDLTAQIAANRTAETRLLALVEKARPRQSKPLRRRRPGLRRTSPPSNHLPDPKRHIRVFRRTR